MTWLLGIIGSFINSITGGLIGDFLRHRGGLSFRFGVPKYVMHGRWDRERQEAVPTPPMFLNYEIPITIHNSAKVPREVVVGNVTFSEEKSEVTKTTNGRSVVTTRNWHGSSLHAMGETITEGEDGKRIKVIRIAAEGITSVVLKGTNSSPAYGGSDFSKWRWVYVAIERVGGEDIALEWDITKRGDRRTCDESIVPFVALPEHYPKKQAASDLTDEQEPMVNTLHNQLYGRTPR